MVTIMFFISANNRHLQSCKEFSLSFHSLILTWQSLVEEEILPIQCLLIALSNVEHLWPCSSPECLVTYVGLKLSS